jgi:hypothetical protein
MFSWGMSAMDKRSMQRGQERLAEITAERTEDAKRRLYAAIEELEALGEPFSQRDLCDHAGVSRKCLQTHPDWREDVNAAIARVGTKSRGDVANFQGRDEDRRVAAHQDCLDRLTEAYTDLSQAGVEITRRSLFHQAGASLSSYYKSAEVKALVDNLLQGVRP